MILVTGATGLNGSELVRRLSARGCMYAHWCAAPPEPGAFLPPDGRDRGG